MSKLNFVLVNAKVRANAAAAIYAAPDGYRVTISEPTRSLDQSAKFHAICEDIAESKMTWAGKVRSATEWKVLLISGHAVATQQPGEVIPGLEGEFVAIRESSARMSVGRASSLIEYTLAFCDANHIELKATRAAGWME